MDRWPDVVEYLAETASVEYKSPAPWGSIKQKIMRTAIAMANTRDGGYIVIGVAGKDGAYVPKGLGRISNTYLRFAELETQISQCATPSLQVEVRIQTFDNKKFAVVAVKGLTDLPHMATRDCVPKKQGIVKGRVYVRTDIPSTEECLMKWQWIELMRIAEEVMGRNYIRKLGVAGCGMQFGKSHPSSRDQFQRERGE